MIIKKYKSEDGFHIFEEGIYKGWFKDGKFAYFSSFIKENTIWSEKFHLILINDCGFEFEESNIEPAGSDIIGKKVKLEDDKYNVVEDKKVREFKYDVSERTGFRGVDDDTKLLYDIRSLLVELIDK